MLCDPSLAMAAVPSRTIRPTVTVFSSIPSVAESLIALSDRLNIPFQIINDKALRGCGGMVEFQPSQLMPETRVALSQAQILLSEPAVVASLLRYDGNCLPNLEWCQSTYAGVDPLFAVADEDEKGGPSAPSTAQRRLTPPSWILTRFAGFLGPPIAEWCIARIIEHERSFAASAYDQTQKAWAGSRGQVTQYRLLSSLTLTILGAFGDIGQCVAKAASRGFGMKVVGYGKSSRPDHATQNSALNEYTTDLQHALQVGDYIVSVLPSTDETRGLLSDKVLAMAAAARKKDGHSPPVLLNVGRGDVVAESTLLTALEQGHLSAAILDVFEQEPLPPHSPLWDHTKIVISPHIGGWTQANDVPKILATNYEYFVSGQPLLYRVDWDKGY